MNNPVVNVVKTDDRHSVAEVVQSLLLVPHFSICDENRARFAAITSVDACGQSFEALVFSDRVAELFEGGFEQIRKKLAPFGFVPNVAAFISWVVEVRPEGCFVSLPEEGQYIENGLEFAPAYDSCGSNVNEPESSPMLFFTTRAAPHRMLVAFRPIKS